VSFLLGLLDFLGDLAWWSWLYGSNRDRAPNRPRYTDLGSTRAQAKAELQPPNARDPD
jgi:hypothetical protein